MTRRALRLALLAQAALLSFGVQQARAQLGPPGGGGIGGSHAPTRSEDSDEDKKQAPPPTIPGAVPSPDTVVPASKTAKDLDPNAALFDAIDRGDLNSARDALNRGADLNARNVLGQRPLDMSIDLSRNAITFLLLSLRSQVGDPDASAPQKDEATDEQTASVPQTKAGRRRRHAPTQAPPVQLATAAAQEPAANTPQPSAGFLGFGSH